MCVCEREIDRERMRERVRERELGTVTFTSPVRQPEVEEEHANHVHVETNEGMCAPRAHTHALSHAHSLSLSHTPDIPAGSAGSKGLGVKKREPLRRVK